MDFEISLNISFNDSKMELFGIYTSSGAFSVKSSYHLLMSFELSSLSGPSTLNGADMLVCERVEELFLPRWKGLVSFEILHLG